MKKFILIVLLFISGCKATEPKPPKPTPIVTDTEYCELAQKHLEELKCVEAEPTKRSKLNFKQFCEQKHQDGIFMNPKCLMTVSCDKIDTCTNSK